MDFDKLLKKRASFSKYSEKDVPYIKVLDAIEAASRAPSPGNLSLLRYIIVKDSDLIEKISQACQQPFISQANAVVVVCSLPKEADIMYDVRASKYVKGTAGASIENFLLKITEMGLVSCWVGAFSELTMRSALNIPDKAEIEAVLPIGYPERGDDTKQKPKPELGNIVYYEKYGEKQSVKTPKVRR